MFPSPSVWTRLRAAAVVWWCYTVALTPVQSTQWPGWTVYPSESEQCPGMVKKQQFRPLRQTCFIPVCWWQMVKSESPFRFPLAGNTSRNTNTKPAVTIIICSWRWQQIWTYWQYSNNNQACEIWYLIKIICKYQSGHRHNISSYSASQLCILTQQWFLLPFQ